MARRIEFTAPIKLPSFANQRMHWAKKARLTKQIREVIGAYLNQASEPSERTVPAKVTITRIHPPFVVTKKGKAPVKPLDKDNLARSIKSVQDQIAQAFGVDDGDSRWDWNYEQGTGQDYGVHVLILRPE